MNQPPFPGDSPSAKIFMCRDNSCVISSHNLHDFLPFLTGKVMISITHHWLWYSQMLINFEIVISERGRGVISLKWMVFVAKVFKRLKFDCQFKWFLCAAPWRAISCFLSWQVWFLCNTPSWHKTVVVWQSSKYKIHV